MRRDTQAAKDLGLLPARLHLGDTIIEAMVSILRSPGRTLLTTMGTLLGTAAFVSVLGIGSTLERQVADTFDIRRATEVTITPRESLDSTEWQQPSTLDTLRALNGVTAAGARVMLGERDISALPGGAGGSENLQLIGADAGAVAAIGPRIVSGRSFDSFHVTRSIPVVMLPATVARSLHITQADVGVFISDQPYSVIGIYDDVVHGPEALFAGIVPITTASTALLKPTDQPKRDIIISTAPGAAALIASQAPYVLSPNSPVNFRASAPPDPRLYRRAIEGSVTTSGILLSAIALILGTLAIATAATSSVATRRVEVGLRRAVGGLPRHIFLQLLTETTVVGLTGGAGGAVLGTAIVLCVSIWNSWVPVLDFGSALIAIGISAGSGLLAGLFPAWRATRIQPVAALQY